MSVPTAVSPDNPGKIPLVYTIPEAADLVRGNRTTIKRAADSGHVRLLSRGRGRFVLAQSLHDWVENGMPLDVGRESRAH
ncbi:MAG: helix-turn-helix domain-containing protein [Candidatus Contendobacter sp.]|nr:helix-turn-helix domain-containing protein [Candidatus Contendobacter sp.]